MTVFKSNLSRFVLNSAKHDDDDMVLGNLFHNFDDRLKKELIQRELFDLKIVSILSWFDRSKCVLVLNLKKLLNDKPETPCIILKRKMRSNLTLRYSNERMLSW